MVTLAEALDMQRKSKAKPTNKYGAKPVKVDGMRFDSTGEYHRWLELQQHQKYKLIRCLKHHVAFPIEINGDVVCDYEADFTYDLKVSPDGHPEKWEFVVEDFKSPITAANPLYRLKIKLMQAVHNIRVLETGLKKG